MERDRHIDSERERGIYRVTMVGGAVNVVLLLFKFVAGIVGHSAAMLADAVHSTSDFVTDVIVLVFVRISSKPKDKSHDYGHGKYETLAMTIIGVALLAVAIGILYNGVMKIASCLKGETLEAPGMLALWAALLSIVLKEAVYRYSMMKARQLQSQAVEANAWHHRSDALSSIGTAILHRPPPPRHRRPHGAIPARRGGSGDPAIGSLRARCHGAPRPAHPTHR